jgi:hypothetical protein
MRSSVTPVAAKSSPNLRALIAAGARPGVFFLSELLLDDKPHSPEESDLAPQALERLHRGELAMQIISLANLYTAWCDRRYLIIGAQENGEINGIAPGALHNELIQEIVQHYCSPAIPCYYQEDRLGKQLVGMIVIADSALKPFCLARDIEYLRDGQNQIIHRQGEIWFQERQQPRLATAEEIAQIKWDAALVKPTDSARKSHGLLGKSEQFPDVSAWDRLIPPEHLAGLIEETPDANLQQEVAEWFWELEESERHFALAVCLFGRLPAEDFWRLYERTVAESWRIRQPGLQIVPGLNARLARYLDVALTFKDRRCRNIILAEALRRYSRPLIWALPQIQQLVIELGDGSAEADRDTIDILSQVVGALALLEWDTALSLLREWAIQRAESTRLAAARALGVTASKSDARFSAAVKLAEDWLRNEPLESGQIAPRHAYRLRWTAAATLGTLASSANKAAFRSEIVPLLWMAVQDTHPRVREAVALAIHLAGAESLPESAGLLGELAAEPSTRAQGRIAAALANLAIKEGALREILLFWAKESESMEAGDWPRSQSAWLALILLAAQDATAWQSLLTPALQSEQTLSLFTELLSQLCLAPSARLQPLQPLLEQLAASEERFQALAAEALLALAQHPGQRGAVQGLINCWRASDVPELVQTAAHWQARWPEIEANASEIEEEQIPGTLEETLADEETTAPLLHRRAEMAAIKAQVTRGPRRWVRQAEPLSPPPSSTRTDLVAILKKLPPALGLVVLAYVVFSGFRYYSAQWFPILLLAVFLAGLLRPTLGAALVWLISSLPLLYYAPALLIALVAFGLFLLLITALLGQALSLEETLVIFGTPVLLLTPLAMAWPFLVAWLWRKRGAYLLFWGALLALLTAPILGQSYLGVSQIQGLILKQSPPAQWQALGWLANLDVYKSGILGFWQILKQLYVSFTLSPLPLVQIALWCLVCWLVGWAVEQADWLSGAILIACVALGLIASYVFVLPDILGWALPFKIDGGMILQILGGALVVGAASYGWPLARPRITEGWRSWIKSRG